MRGLFELKKECSNQKMRNCVVSYKDNWIKSGIEYYVIDLQKMYFGRRKSVCGRILSYVVSSIFIVTIVTVFVVIKKSGRKVKQFQHSLQMVFQHEHHGDMEQ